MLSRAFGSTPLGLAPCPCPCSGRSHFLKYSSVSEARERLSSSSPSSSSLSSYLGQLFRVSLSPEMNGYSGLSTLARDSRVRSQLSACRERDQVTIFDIKIRKPPLSFFVGLSASSGPMVFSTREVQISF